MSETIEYVRLVESERRVADTLAAVSRSWRHGRERFLFVSPHDDDVAIGAGIFLQLAQREGVAVAVGVVTDGAMGYCSEADREGIVEIRRAETFAAHKHLGVPVENIYRLEFPDCQLAGYLGRRVARDGDAAVVAGHTGLQNGLTHLLRTFRPTQVFVPTFTDLHPDHRMVHSELMISIFHATGDIWPELGEKLPTVPYVSEMAVYCDFPSPPQLRITTPMSYLDKKLESLAKFASQRQIGALIENVRAGGSVEFLRSMDIQLYQPSRYVDRFNEQAPPMMPTH